MGVQVLGEEEAEEVDQQACCGKYSVLVGAVTRFSSHLPAGSGEHVHDRKARNVSNVMGCELRRQLRLPGAGDCCESIGEFQRGPFLDYGI